jgi:phage tail sheath protein FI
MAAHALYEDPETIDVNLFIDADKSTAVKSDMITIAEARKDSMAILDVPISLVVNNRGNETGDMRDFRLGIHSTYNLNENTSYAALYGNWLEIYDKWNGRYRWIPPAGHMAGIYAKTDDISDPWFAPAGLNRALITNVRKLGYNPNQANRDICYKNGINPIVSFAGQGKVVWGQKTMLDKNSAFNRVNVRRLFIILEKAISTAVKYFLFEPNDSFTRLQLINMIEPFLRDVKSRRGIYDYLVVCDSSNNTAERIDRNELWCDLYIKPTKAAEFIVLNFIATKTGASFTELVAAGQTPTSGV